MRYFLIAMMWLPALGSWAQGTVQVEFTAKGCCLMCEERIVGAMDVPGVRLAEWDASSEKAVVVYRVRKISEERLQQLVADAGHDTDLFVASDDVYSGLEQCCLYRSGCQGCSEKTPGVDSDGSHSDEGEDDRN